MKEKENVDKLETIFLYFNQSMYLHTYITGINSLLTKLLHMHVVALVTKITDRATSAS